MMRLPVAGAAAVDFVAEACALEASMAVRSGFGDRGAALLLCAAATAIEAATAATATARRRSAPRRSAPRLPGRTTAAAPATTPMATGFARTGMLLTERRKIVVRGRLSRRPLCL